jgi:hypothetical protein
MNWKEQAACNIQTASMFDSIEDFNAEFALYLCSTCPVIVECEQWRAAQMKDFEGVVAGRVYGGVFKSAQLRQARKDERRQRYGA